MIVTVTLNAALDRTLTVPNFQLGQRHRASEVLTLAGGKGINVARALKRLDVPVVATGLAGGRTGTRIVEELTERGDPQRLRPHRATSRAPRPPSSTRPRARTPRSTSGARRCTEASSRCCSRSSRYLSRGADVVVFAGSLPRGVDDGFYADAVRELDRRGVRVVLDSEGEPLRLGHRGGAVARLAEPARGRAARRPGARRRGGLPDGARHDRRARRAERP